MARNRQSKQTQKCVRRSKMAFIATYWYIWLVVMLVGYGYALANHLRRIRGVMKAPMLLSFNDVENALLKGIGAMFLSAAIGVGGMVMLIIATIVNIIKYAG